MDPAPATAELLARLDRVLSEDIRPLEADLLQRGPEAVDASLMQLRRKHRRQGLWNFQLPRHLDGVGLSLSEFAHVSERLGQSPLAHAAFNCQAPDAGNMEILERQATPAQKERFLLPLARGEIRSCFAMTEPEHAGSNPVWMSTSASRQGDGWRLNGHKWFVTSAHGADFALVMAITDPDAPRHGRASQFLVSMDTPGVEHVRRIRIMGEEGASWFSHSELRFRDVELPADALLGPRGAGFRVAQERLGPGRIHHCMRWLGICRRALDMMASHGVSREVAPGRALGTRQSFQHALAELEALVAGARLLVLDTARQIERQGHGELRSRISMIKFHTAGVLQDVVDAAIQAMGAAGVSDDHVLSWWYRHERCARIYDGTDEVHKTVVARDLLARHGLQVGF